MVVVDKMTVPTAMDDAREAAWCLVDYTALAEGLAFDHEVILWKETLSGNWVAHLDEV